MTFHASAVALKTAAGWRAVLLRGPSGSGKSDLALRLIGGGDWRLVGDDQVQVWMSGGALYVAGAPRLSGALEVRGVGLQAVPALDFARVALIADCGVSPDRLPMSRSETLEGVAVPVLALAALEPSAPGKLRLAISGRDVLSRLEP